MTTKTKTPKKKAKKPSYDWDKILRLSPGYDPFKNAADCYFDEVEAMRAIDFIQTCLKHVKGEKAGQYIKLEDWQLCLIGNLFGWMRPDGSRRYREGFIYVPRKNGKSILVACIGNTLLFIDGEYGAEIYSAACDKDQAAIVWGMAARQIELEPTLKKNSQTYKAAKSIVIEKMGSFFKPISREANSKHGYDAHGILNDELHAHKDGELTDVLITSTAARRQPLVLHLTTADYKRESICNEKYDYACKVRDGIIIDPFFLPFIYEADEKKDDWTKESTWKKANPNYGISVKKEYMLREFKKAQNTPRYENTFKRLHLNIRTENATRWIDMEKWRDCAGKLSALELAKSLKGKSAFGGLDLSITTDLSSLSLFFPEEKNACLNFNWAPIENARKRQKKDRVPYLDWAKQGFIKLTPGESTNYEFIIEDIFKICEMFNIIDIGFDPFNSVSLHEKLIAEGIEMVKYRQGPVSMNAPCKEIERMVLNKEIIHGDNPVLTWAMSNVTLKLDEKDNASPDRKKSTEKIDPVVALIMAIGRAQVRKIKKKSIYSTRGITRL